MNVVTSMPRTIARLAPFLLAIALWSGCGGSGSSGFDALPATEPEAIARAIEQSKCLGFDDTTFCASDVEATTEDETQSVKVRIEEPEAPLVCRVRLGRAGCRTAVTFTPRRFPPGTTFVAATSASEDGPWTLTETVPASAPGQAPLTRTVRVTLPAPGTPDAPVSLLLAVLVYTGEAPADLPTQTQRLTDFGADFVFVSRRLEVGGEG
jgi:hypothetical protein